MFCQCEKMTVHMKIPTKIIILFDLALLGLAAFAFFGPKNESVFRELKAEEIKTLSQTIAGKCQGSGWHDCYQKEMPKITKDYGLAPSEQVLLAVQEIDQNAKNCHVIAHLMSREAYNRNPDEFDELLQSLNVNACGSGFLHGVMEAYLGQHPETEVNGDFAGNICTKKIEQYWQRMCAHFMGHIFLVENSGVIDQSLRLCDAVKMEWRFDCFNGLFMEDHQKLALAEHGIAPLPTLTPDYMKSMEETCLQYSGPKGQACWTEMAEMYAHAYGYDPEIIYKGCQKGPDAASQQICYGKGIVVTAVYTGFDTADKLTGICKFYKNTPQFSWCVNSIISALMFYSPKYVDRGLTLCTSIGSNYQTGCLENLAARLQSILPQTAERIELCTTLDKNQELCNEIVSRT